MELTKPTTLTFSQELMLAMKAKQENEEKQKELQDIAFLVKPQPFIDYSKVVELKAQYDWRNNFNSNPNGYRNSRWV